MTKSTKQLVAIVAVCAIGLIAAGTAQAKGANYACGISGTIGSTWSGNCTMDSGGTLKCSGKAVYSTTMNAISGSCAGFDPIFGKTSCSLKGKFTWLGGGTWKATGPVGCSYGVGFSCGPNTWSGGGVTGTLNAFKGRLDWFC